MALFAGIWPDQDGNPFDPDAQVSQEWEGGGAAAVRRRGTRPHPNRDQFVRSIRSAADHWRNTLTTADRAGWTYEGSLGTTKRGSIDRTPVNGFIQYNAYDGITHYYQPPSLVGGPTEAEPGFHWASIVWVWTARQEVSYRALAVAGLNAFAHARLAVFQINPRDFLFDKPWKATRCIDIVAPPDFDPALIERTVKLRWFLIPGEGCRLLFRGRVASRWGFHDDDSKRAP